MNEWQKPDGSVPHIGYEAHEAIARIARGDEQRAADLVWAIRHWNAEVAQRPLVNVHRRTLDDTWRKVIRHFGGEEALKLIAAPHDELLAAHQRPTGLAFPTDASGVAASAQAVQAADSSVSVK